MADINELVSKLDRRVQPNDEFYKFTSEDLLGEIEDTISLLDLTVETLTAKQEVLVLYKARSSCYYTLASKYAENMRFRVENDEYHGQHPYEHYMALAKRYEDLFNENLSIEVNTVTRTQTGTGLKAPYYAGDKP
jgi:hypothetical protein